MIWFEKMNLLHKTLIEKSPLRINDELYNAVMFFRKARHEVVMMGGNTAHISPFWSDAELILPPPNNPSLVMYLALKEVAESHGVPVSWLYLLPYTVSIDSAVRQVMFKEGVISYTDLEGYARHESVIAHHEGVKAGLIDEDEPLPFALSPFAEEYSGSVNEVVQEISKQYGVTKDEAKNILQGKHIDAPFPYENDDSLWGMLE